ncbi:MAG TPA: methionyl-tRNA formyltransferase [Candidatus Hydrogenedentes bacterium]|nr:methionyl-tRNA formyltransferase [Candidatus Hydrogenedentota bacterium]
MRIVFLGTPALAVPSVEAVAARHEITAVVCQPDRPLGRSNRPVPPPVKCWAMERGIPIHQPEKLNDGSFAAWLRAQAPELCAITAYGRLLKQPILDIPPKGWLNMHPSLLPRHRGPSPIQTAILEGDTVTGVTIMRLTLEMDSGDILLQASTPVDPDENAEELTARLAQLGADLLAEGVDRVAAGTAVFTPQDPAQATYCNMFEKEHGRIRWGNTAGQIHNQVRACLPWPVAHCLYQGEVCRIHRSVVIDQPAKAAPGTVTLVEKDWVIVATGEGQLGIIHFQAPGKRAMAMEDFLRGHPMQAGERFEEIR